MPGFSFPLPDEALVLAPRCLLLCSLGGTRFTFPGRRLGSSRLHPFFGLFSLYLPLILD